MYKLHDIQQIQPQQNYRHKPFLIRQELPKSTSFINEVQTKHRLLTWQTPINTSKVRQQQKRKTQNHKHQVLSNKSAAFQNGNRQPNGTNRKGRN
jgi:hypothetical protein